jgi:hypothetical protein
MNLGDKFYLGDSKCYFVDNIYDSNNKSNILKPTKTLFTTSKSVVEEYYFTGKCGFEEVYLRSNNGILKFSSANLELPKVNASKIPLGLYKHFKGGEYLVLGVAFNLDNSLESVIYESLCLNGKIFDREYNNFLDNVTSEEFNYSGPRFKLVSKE